MPSEDDSSSYLERLAALDLLRENILFSQPNKLNISNSFEDLPGVFRSAVPLTKNIIPSASIISRDAEERKKQINDAIKKIKSVKKHEKSLGHEIIDNVYNLGIKAMPLSFILSSAFHLASPRNPFHNGKLRPPITPLKNIKKFLDSSRYRGYLSRQAAKDSLIGGGLGAVSGALYPIVSSTVNPSDKALEEAATILQNEPLLTSLPPAEFLSVMRNDANPSPTNKFKNVLLGTGIGTGIGALGAVSSAGMKGLFHGASNLYRKMMGQPLNKNTLKNISSGLLKDLKVTLPLGAGLGVVSGLTTKNLSDYDQQKTDTNQA
jgi:hypothetical protein